MNITSSIVRVQRATAFLLAFGVAAASSGAWLLYTAPSGATAEALARLETQAAPLARTPAVPRLPALTPVAMHDGASVLPARYEVASDNDFVVSVEVRAQVSGRIASVRFEPGSYVEKGETLFVLDPAPFVVALAHAESTVKSARARLGEATAALGRAQRAFDAGTIEQGELDAHVHAQREAHGVLRAAAMVLESARRDLGLTRVVAPINGRVAAVRVNVGDRVTPAPDGRSLITIVSSEPIYAASTDRSGFVQVAYVR